MLLQSGKIGILDFNNIFFVSSVTIASISVSLNANVLSLDTAGSFWSKIPVLGPQSLTKISLWTLASIPVELNANEL